MPFDDIEQLLQITATLFFALADLLVLLLNILYFSADNLVPHRAVCWTWERYTDTARPS